MAMARFLPDLPSCDLAASDCVAFFVAGGVVGGTGSADVAFEMTVAPPELALFFPKPFASRQAWTLEFFSCVTSSTVTVPLAKSYANCFAIVHAFSRWASVKSSVFGGAKWCTNTWQICFLLLSVSISCTMKQVSFILRPTITLDQPSFSYTNVASMEDGFAAMTVDCMSASSAGDTCGQGMSPFGQGTCTSPSLTTNLSQWIRSLGAPSATHRHASFEPQSNPMIYFSIVPCGRYDLVHVAIAVSP